MAGSIRVFFRFLSNEPKAPALWATLAFWILNISLAVTARADYHAVFLRLKNLLAHFSPRAEILLSFFSVFEHTSGHPPLRITRKEELRKEGANNTYKPWRSVNTTGC
jgi:hypothetical protein